MNNITKSTNSISGNKGINIREDNTYYQRQNSNPFANQIKSRNNKEFENNTDNISNISNNNSIITPNIFNQNANGNTTIDLNLNLSNQLKNNDSIISVSFFMLNF